MVVDDQDRYDVVIVGGGLVGASLACALDGHGLRIAVVEATPLGGDTSASFDERSIALAYGSKRIFDTLGLWPAIAELGVAPIERIHVSEHGQPGVTRLDCAAEDVEALGYVAPSRVLGHALTERLAACADVQVFCPARLSAMELGERDARLVVDHDGNALTLNAALVAGADGGQSAVRELVGIGSRVVDYGQTAVVTNIRTELGHGGTAYERFTPQGPLAVLPLPGDAGQPDNRCAVVWTHRSAAAEEVLELDDEGFRARLQAAFGQRLGRIERVGVRAAYPLVLRHAREHVRARLALIGNAAHTLHPVAGQGFNLGLRDVAVLAQVLVDAARMHKDIGAAATLAGYAKWRRRDHLQVIVFTDSLVRLFSNAFPPLVVARNLGLIATDILPPVKHVLTRQAMGLAGRLPRLARGLPL